MCSNCLRHATTRTPCLPHVLHVAYRSCWHALCMPGVLCSAATLLRLNKIPVTATAERSKINCGVVSFVGRVATHTPPVAQHTSSCSWKRSSASDSLPSLVSQRSQGTHQSAITGHRGLTEKRIDAPSAIGVPFCRRLCHVVFCCCLKNRETLNLSFERKPRKF